jgi:hypothetical protein
MDNKAPRYVLFSTPLLHHNFSVYKLPSAPYFQNSLSLSCKCEIQSGLKNV